MVKLAELNGAPKFELKFQPQVAKDSSLSFFEDRRSNSDEFGLHLLMNSLAGEI